jgi:hypothetical protein
MDKATFEAAAPFIDELADLTDDMLTSTELARMREALTQLGKTLGERYSVSLSVIVDVCDRDKERCLPLLNNHWFFGEPWSLDGSGAPTPAVLADDAVRKTGSSGICARSIE